MKIIAIALVATLWLGYAAGHDKKPVPKYYYYLIHGLYAMMLGTAAMI